MAQFSLGVMYENGEGVPQDYKEAVKWYRKAAEQGYAKAQYHLGFILLMKNSANEGVEQDGVEAVKWYRKAAEQGNAKAQNFLGEIYFSGDGVPRDDIEAHKWFNLAAADGLDKSEDLDRVAFKMSPEQIAEAQKRAREWKPETPASK